MIRYFILTAAVLGICGCTTPSTNEARTGGTGFRQPYVPPPGVINGAPTSFRR